MSLVQNCRSVNRVSQVYSLRDFDPSGTRRRQRYISHRSRVYAVACVLRISSRSNLALYQT